MPGDFYEIIPVLDDFADAVRGENYSPLPDDWVVGFADVVGSTKAVADGRYKAVNMVGAGAIAAVASWDCADACATANRSASDNAP